MFQDSLFDLDCLNKEYFLKEYLKNKAEWVLSEPVLDNNDNFYSLHSSNGIILIEIFKEETRYICQIVSNVDHSCVGYFGLPKTYKEFKTIVDILIKNI